MAFHLPNGSHVFMENEAGAAIAASAISNAAQAVLTLPTSHGLVQGDVIRVVSASWSSLAGMVFRVGAVSGATVTIPNLNTTDTNLYPAGNSTASIVKITSWVEIPQITEVSSDGNEQQFYSFQFLSDDKQRNMPTYKSAATMTYTIAHDMQAAVYPLLRTADRAGATRAFYMYVPKGNENRYWSAVPSFNDTPRVTINELEVVTLSLAVQSERMTFSAVTP